MGGKQSIAKNPKQRSQYEWIKELKHDSYPKNRYLSHSQIAIGAFSRVCKGRIINANRKECTTLDNNVAIKTYRTEKLISERHLKLLYREIFILRQLEFERHPNILQFVDFYSDSVSINLVTELCQLNLKESLNHAATSTEDIPKIIYQILKGIEFLHDATIVHRDIKPGNILIAADGKTLKISDFGLARAFHNCESNTIEDINLKLTPRVGTWNYISPEMCVCSALWNLRTPYVTTIDIWGVGCIMAELWFGYPIMETFLTEDDKWISMFKPICKVVGQYNNMTENTIFQLVFDKTVPEYGSWAEDKKHLEEEMAKFPQRNSIKKDKKKIKLYEIMANAAKHDAFNVVSLMARTELDIPESQDGTDLLRRLLTFDPELRITVAEALSHKFFKSLQKRDYPDYTGISKPKSVYMPLHEDILYTSERYIEEIKNFIDMQEKGIFKDFVREKQKEQANHWTNIRETPDQSFYSFSSDNLSESPVELKDVSVPHVTLSGVARMVIGVNRLRNLTIKKNNLSSSIQQSKSEPSNANQNIDESNQVTVKNGSLLSGVTPALKAKLISRKSWKRPYLEHFEKRKRTYSSHQITDELNDSITSNNSL